MCKTAADEQLHYREIKKKGETNCKVQSCILMGEGLPPTKKLRDGSH
jgi:hypothetical protein